MAFEWMNELSRDFLSKGYIPEGMSGEDRVREIANHAESILNITGFGDKFYEYMGKGYFSLSSPVWSNYGRKRGLPVSCFGSYLSDSISSILSTHTEVGIMSKFGGGCSGYFGNIRGRGDKFGEDGSTFGSVHFMELFDKLASVVSQGSVRRGFFSPYLPIEHKDAKEFIAIGDEGHPIQGLTHGVTVTDKWLKEMEEGDKEKRTLWAQVIKSRSEKGYPYIVFKDNMNNNKPQVYKDNDMDIVASNMCSEIALPSNDKESFVCVLSSMNLLHYDEWKDTDAVETLIYFLDTVVSEFLNKVRDLEHSDPIAFNAMNRAYTFAKNHRALGLGVLGWHSYLQKNMIAFESAKAAKVNIEISKLIKERAESASRKLAYIYGTTPLLSPYKVRNATLTAIAPTKSSSFILGQVSQGIEPEDSNIYIKDLAKTKAVVRNPYLTAHLESLGMNTDEVWESIKVMRGSVQHLDIPNKEVFKTFDEISPMAIINQAAGRQPYIDQAQSLNLKIHPSTPTKDVNQLYLTAWKMGVKSLYYQFNVNAAQEFARKSIIECEACSA